MEDGTTVTTPESKAPIADTSATMSISSGSASEAMLKAVAAASSAEAQTPAEKPATGDTTTSATAKPAEQAQPKTATSEQEKPSGSEKPADSTRDPQLEGRFKTVAANARKQVLTDYGLIDSRGQVIAPARVRLADDFLTEFQSDPAAFHQRLTAELKGSVSDDDEKWPDATVLPDGTKAYSDDQLKKMFDIHERRIEKRLLGGKLKSVTSFVEKEQLARKAAEERGKVLSVITNVMTEARKLQHFTENEAAIEAKINSWSADVRKDLGIAGSVYRAYNEVMAETVKAREADIEKKVRESYDKKAATSAGSQHPTNSQGGAAKKPELRNARDLAARMREMEAQTAQP